jgi:hypothetical protein
MEISIGEICYNAYKEAVGGKTWNGDTMKTYDEMPEHAQYAWTKAGVVAKRHGIQQYQQQCQKNIFDEYKKQQDSK